MASEADKFSLDISKWMEKVENKANELCRSVAIQVLTSVIEKSPVGNPSTWKNPPPPGYVGGRFRANWQLSVGSPKTGNVDAVDPSGSQTVSRESGILAGYKAGPFIYLANNLPYGPRLEYEGWSKQAPAGMVRITVAEFQGIVDDEVRKLK